MSKQTCEKCGATLPAEGATCRRCLMELAASAPLDGPAEPVSTRVPRPAPPPEPHELAPLFPELEIESLLGTGGMGAVYKARQVRLGRVVALKVLHPELSGDPVFVERFLREAQALAKLAHPGIVSVYEYGERGGRCFLLMEHVDGANLRVLLRSGTLGSRQALEIVRQLCDALQFAHDEGVVHRDIKPENVLIDAKGRVKVADFGLAKLVGQPASFTLTDAGQVMGTPHYMAPEQVEHPRDVDHRADLFSLGVVFYEMLTGELPLGRFAVPSQRVQIDVRLDEIVMKSLEYERERRYQHAVQVKTAVEKVEREPATERNTEKKERRRHPLRVRSGVYLPHLQAAFFWPHKPAEWAWIALLSAAWIACGASFGLGAVWFFLISLTLLPWFYLSMVVARAGVEPREDERIGRSVFVATVGTSSAKAARIGWIVRLRFGAFCLAALGVVVLFVAHVASWERWTWNYVSSDQGPRAGIERLSGREAELLRGVGITLDARGPALVDLRVATRSSYWTSNSTALFVLHPLLLVVIAGALLYLAGRLALPPDRRSGLPSRRGPAYSLALLASSLIAVHLLVFAIHGRKQELRGVCAEQKCSGDAEELGDRLYRELVARELHVHAEHSAEIVDRRSGATLAGVHVLAAAPASIFDRWHLTWSGPRRTEPHVLFTIVSDPTGERASITADGGLVERDDPGASGWDEELRATLTAACAESSD